MNVGNIQPGDIIVLWDKFNFLHRLPGVTSPCLALITKINVIDNVWSNSDHWPTHEAIINGVLTNIRLYSPRIPYDCIIKREKMI